MAVKFYKYGYTEDYYENTLKVTQHEPKIPYHDKIKIQISNPSRKPGGLFGLTSHYILFKIATKPYNWEVSRKMKDFVWLRNLLVKLYPSKIIPPLDTKNSDKDKHTQSKRMKFLQNFVNDLKYTQEIWTNQYVVAFLSETDDKKFELQQKESEKERDIDNVDKQVSVTGTVDAKIHNDLYIFKEELDKYLLLQEKTYLKLHSVSK